MQKPYKTLSDMAEDEFVEQRSRFIGAVSPAANAEEAAAFIQKRRKMHPDARHHVFAYTLLDGTCRCSDDGEPQGTGGVPLLTVLQGNELFNAVVVVTRYFGGILLGTRRAVSCVYAGGKTGCIRRTHCDDANVCGGGTFLQLCAVWLGTAFYGGKRGGNSGNTVCGRNPYPFSSARKRVGYLAARCSGKKCRNAGSVRRRPRLFPVFGWMIKIRPEKILRREKEKFF